MLSITPRKRYIAIQLKLPINDKLAKNQEVYLCDLASYARKKILEAESIKRAEAYKELAAAASELTW